jgi:hypothetical protein
MINLTGGRRWRAATMAVVGGGLAVAVAACGSSVSNRGSLSASSDTAVSQALHNTTSAPSLSARISVNLTADQLQQLPPPGGGSAMTAKEAQALAGGSIFVDVSTGNGEPLNSQQAATDSANNYDVGLTTTDGTTPNTPVELRVVKQNLYLLLNLSQLESDTGQTSSSLSQLSTELGKLNADIPGISDLAAGKWVEVTHSTLQQLLDLLNMAGAGQGSSAGSNLSALYPKLIQDIESAIKTNSGTTKGASSGGRTEYNVTVKVKPLVEQIASIVQNDLNSVPGGLGAKYAGSISKAAGNISSSQTAVMQAYVQDNKLQEIDIDLNQFAPPSQRAKPAIPIKITLGPSPSISAPNKATQLNLSKLPELLGGMAAILGGNSGS